MERTGGFRLSCQYQGKIMKYLLCKHKVQDFDRWHHVFASHDQAQRDSALHLLHLLRDGADPNNVVMLFRIDDLDKANAFLNAPEAEAAADISGVIGTPEVLYLND